MTDPHVVAEDHFLTLAREQNFPAAALYVVATPIGNLADISARALECLRRMDAIAAEDTRMARRLLHHYGIDKPCFAAHRHNEHEAAAAVIARLARGERVAYISDAGTPGISDPGVAIVDAVHRAGWAVIPIPGASALACALSIAGLSDGPCYFAGFVPAKRQQAHTALQALSSISAQLVFYEAPHRICEFIETCVAVLGAARRVVIAREMTKLFESIHRSTLGEVGAWLAADANRQRGEFVVIIEGASVVEDVVAAALPMLVKLMAVLPLSQAVDLTAEFTQVGRKLLYERALQLRDRPD